MRLSGALTQQELIGFIQQSRRCVALNGFRCEHFWLDHRDGYYLSYDFRGSLNMTVPD